MSRRVSHTTRMTLSVLVGLPWLVGTVLAGGPVAATLGPSAQVGGAVLGPSLDSPSLDSPSSAADGANGLGASGVGLMAPRTGATEAPETDPAPDDPAPDDPVRDDPVPDDPVPGQESASAADPDATVAESLDQVLRDFAGQAGTGWKGRVGLAVTPCAPAGGRGDETVMAGSWRTGHAWSTSKVPTALAALRTEPSRYVESLTRQAITYSDNDAAAGLRAVIGGLGQAAEQVEVVVREFDPGGEPIVLDETGLGTWLWSLQDSAVFAAGLAWADDDASGFVLDQMGQIDEDQRWGLGQIPGTVFKGGWGPEDDGFLVRQLGIVTTATGECWGVAMASLSRQGMDEATEDLSAIARWFWLHRAAFPAGQPRSQPATRLPVLT